MARQPIFNVPGVIVASFALLGLIHGIREYVLSDNADAATVYDSAKGTVTISVTGSSTGGGGRGDG